MKNRTADLTEGVIWKCLLFFFLPIFARSLFQQLYTTIDAVIVGQFVGKQGLASIDAVSLLIKIPTHFLLGLSVGTSILVSQYYGAKEMEKLARIIHSSIYFAIGIGSILSVIGLIIAPYCIKLLDVPSEIAAQSLVYVQICFSGLLFTTLFNIGAGILQAIGDAKTPFIILAIAGLLHTLLAFLLIGYFKMGTTGAALATVFSQLISSILVLKELRAGYNGIQLKFSKLRLDLSDLRSIIRLGLPVGGSAVLYPLVNLLVQISINRTGMDSIAAWSLSGKLDFLVWVVADSLGAAISTFVAQNYGARLYERARDGVKIGLLMTSAFICIISIILYFWCEPLGKLFIKAADYDVIPILVSLMRLMAPFYLGYVIAELLSGALRGMGNTLRPMLVMLVGTCVSRILWIYLVAVPGSSVTLIAACFPVSWVLSAILVTLLYRKDSKIVMTI